METNENEWPVRVRSVDELKKLTDNGEGCNVFIALCHGLRSSKHISRDGDTWYVYNEVDDTEDVCTDADISGGRIGECIAKGTLYRYTY